MQLTMNPYVSCIENLLNLSALPSSYKNKTKQKVKRHEGEKEEKYSLCSHLLLTLQISSPEEDTKTLKVESRLGWN
jgi:hypothetical protein